MTDPYGHEGYRPPYPPPPGAYPYVGGQFPGAQGHLPGAYGDPMAPFGRHPFTGEPLSDKSKTTAGLLQLIGIVGVVGIGRLYIGQNALGGIQLGVGLFCLLILSWITCGLSAFVPVVWGVIDAIVLLTGNGQRDGTGRILRDGT